MKVLITGASGQLGSEFVEFLTHAGVQFFAYTSGQLNIAEAAELESVLNSTRPDVLINCAAYTKVDEAEIKQDRAFLVNFAAVKNMAELCARHSVLLVHFSTDYIFKGTALDSVNFPDGYPEEGAEPDPETIYGKSKLLGEQSIINSGCAFLLIRVSWVCGKNGFNFVKTMLRLAAEKPEINVVNDQFGSPGFAANIVRNVWELIKQNKTGIWNITSRGTVTWFDLACETLRYAGFSTLVKPVGTDEYPTQANRPYFSKLDTKKAESTANIEIEDWKDGLHKLIDQLKK